MCCISSHKQSAKRSAIKSIALILCVCFILVSFLLTAFIITHTNHEHDHGGPNGSCATCIQLTSAENLLKQISAALTVTGFIFAFLSLISLFLKPIALHIGSFTLVSLKVRLNN